MGLIGRRCTAVMPSRPVLIGRGLVPTTYKTTHPYRAWRSRYVTPRAHQRTHTRTHVHCSRPLRSSQPTNPSHTPVWGFERVERVTAAIAKRETPGPIPNPE